MESTRHRVASIADLEEHGERVVADVDGITVAVFNVDGEYHAIANRCPHVGGPMGKGTLTGHSDVSDDGEIVYDETEDVLECPWHCWRFHVPTGRNVDDGRFGVPTFDVEIDSGDVYVVL